MGYHLFFPQEGASASSQGFIITVRGREKSMKNIKRLLTLPLAALTFYGLTACTKVETYKVEFGNGYRCETRAKENRLKFYKDGKLIGDKQIPESKYGDEEYWFVDEQGNRYEKKTYWYLDAEENAHQHTKNSTFKPYEKPYMPENQSPRDFELYQKSVDKKIKEGEKIFDKLREGEKLLEEKYNKEF